MLTSSVTSHAARRRRTRALVLVLLTLGLLVGPLTGTASADGTASPVNTGPDCTNLPQHIGILWHSDGTSHGASPGKIGVDTHTALLADTPGS